MENVHNDFYDNGDTGFSFMEKGILPEVDENGNILKWVTLQEIENM